MTRFQLGSRVKITGTALKVRKWEKNQGIYGKTMVRWVDGPPPQRRNYPTVKTFTEGVIVGSRTVQEGRVHRDYEDGSSFIPEVGSAMRVWLVAFDLRMKPAMCFDHQLQPSE